MPTTANPPRQPDLDLTREFQPLDPGLVRLMTPEELKQYEEALEGYMALLSPLNFAAYASGADRMRHIEYLDSWLAAGVEGHLYRDGPGPHPVYKPTGPDDGQWVHPDTGEEALYRLAIAMPPRHGKSYLTSHHLPAWAVMRWPTRTVAVASYEADFAASWGKKARDLVKEHGPKFGVLLDNTSSAGARWHLTPLPNRDTGGMLTAGAGGPFTGKGAQVIVIDDPIKNAEEANSEAQRENLKNWYLAVAFTRLEPRYVECPCCGVTFPMPGFLVLMNTRWHEDDLQGFVTSEEPERWAVVNLPALAEPNDPLGRSEGEALAPERYPASVLQIIREQQGAYWFGAMYQGTPHVTGDGIIHGPFQYHQLIQAEDRGGGAYEYRDRAGTLKRTLVSDCIRFATLDLAASVKTRADYTVLAVWDETPDRELLLHDVWRVRMESPDHEEKVRTWLGTLDPPVRYLGIEDRTFGTSLIQNMMRSGGVVIRPLKADTDKIARAIPAGQVVANGEVWFPKHHELRSELEHELEAFPNGRNDDFVDVLAYAIQEHVRMPRRKPKSAQLDQSLQARANRHLDKLLKEKKGRGRHTVIGRW